MKTWTEFIGVKEPNDTLSLPINKHQYKQIQLDAMKEGARRAATIANSGKAEDKYVEAGMKMCAEAILAAAEQWTEKDL